MSEPHPAPRRRSGPWPFVIGLVALVAILAGSLLYVFHVVTRAPAAVVREGRQVLGDLARVADAFRTGSVTTTFISYATEVSGVSRLQFATLSQMELFERTDEATVLWGNLDLPDLVVEARAPVEYSYYLDLGGRWDFEQEGRRIRVVAPPIEANTPAVDVSRMRYEVRAGSLFRDEAGALERLTEGVTEMSRRRARENIPLILELGRKKTEEFVAGWLAGQFADGVDYSVEVLFRDEIEPLRSPDVELPGRGIEPGLPRPPSG